MTEQDSSESRYAKARAVYNEVKRPGRRVLTLPEIQRVIEAHEAVQRSQDGSGLRPIWWPGESQRRRRAQRQARWDKLISKVAPGFTAGEGLFWGFTVGAVIFTALLLLAALL